jgi:uncharacterized membrane protein
VGINAAEASAWGARMARLFEEKNVRRAFEASLVLKGIFAALETVAGVLVYFVSQEFLLKLILAFTKKEYVEDRHDALASYLIELAQDFSVNSRLFASFYLLSHGILKLFLIVGLMRRKLSYYPAAILIFTLFIVYQLYRFSFTHSIWLLLITLLDLVVIWLTWHEYELIRRERYREV